MKFILSALIIFWSVPVLAQEPALQGEFQLDMRNRLGFDYPYQRWDYPHTAALRLEASAKDQTHMGILVQRKYFATRIVEAQVERPLSSTFTLRAGLQRLPFGIYDWQETYRSGLIDYAMPRVDYGATGMEQSVTGLGGTIRQDRLQAEGVAFSGKGTTVWNTYTPYRGGAGRVQLFLPTDTILGLSHCSESQAKFGGGEQQVRMSGVDLRYTRPYLVLRGEVLQGTIAGLRYAGAYLDGFYRLPGLPAWTITARGERLRPTPSSPSTHQATLGVRWTIDSQWTTTVNWRGNDIGTKYLGSWVPQSGKHGDVLVQIYHRAPLAF